MRRFRPNLRLAFAAALALSWGAAFSARDSRAVNCGAGQSCLCVQTVVDTCAANGGQPPACDPCRGVFQPCYDMYCDYDDYRCVENSDGDPECTETLVSVVKGLHRSCIGSSLDWVYCWGQPKCVTDFVQNVAGNRYTCSTGGS